MRTEIIYEDKDILVVYKPAGLATQTAKLGQADVVSELKNYMKQSYVGVIHRLDQPVEGLLVFAKHKKAAADLTAQLQRQSEGGSLNKHYYAVICGKLEVNQGRLVDYMYKSPENLAVIVEKAKCETVPKETTMSGKAEVVVQSKTNRDGNQIKEAILEYEIVKHWDNVAGEAAYELPKQPEEESTRELALADINILTGRFHQIRAQMAHAGMPLLGDAKYGSPEAKELARALGVQTVALCAYSLEFIHPVSKKKMQFKENPRGKAFSFFGKE